MFLSTIRQAVREKRQAIADRDEALFQLEVAKEEVKRLQEKLEKRTDFFVEREFRIFDRFFTSEKKTYAITDEIKQKEDSVKYAAEARDAALTAYLEDKREFLERCAREANYENWKDVAAEKYKANYNQYVVDFDQRA